MELDRSTQVDVLLKLVGCMALFGGFICALVFWPQSGGNEAVRSLLMSTAITYAMGGIIAAIFTFGFAEIIRLLDVIRAQGNTMPQSHLQPASVAANGTTNTDGDNQTTHNGSAIVENSDGTYSVGGRNYKSYETAQAYVDFMAARR